jgi:hypothetical protein
MSEIEQIKVFLRSQPDLRHGVGAEQQEILELERTWKHRLPSDYSAFLQLFGWATYGSVEIPGLGRDVPAPHLDVYELAVRAWAPPLQMSRDFLPVFESGGDWLYCLHTSASGQELVSWSLENDQQRLEETYPSWSDWFRAHFMEPR